MEFATGDNCVLIDGPLVHVRDEEYLYVTPEMKWADPDVDRAALELRRLFDDREYASRIGQRAKETITKNHGVEAMAARYASRLRELGIEIP